MRRSPGGEAGKQAVEKFPADAADVRGDGERALREGQMDAAPVPLVRPAGQKSLLDQIFHGLGYIPLLEHSELHNVPGGILLRVILQKGDDVRLDLGDVPGVADLAV